MSVLACASVNPCVCPVCGEPNLCAMEVAKASGQPVQPCWCVHATFSADLLARVPAPAQGKACVCQRCAQSNAPPQSSRHV